MGPAYHWSVHQGWPQVSHILVRCISASSFGHLPSSGLDCQCLIDRARRRGNFQHLRNWVRIWAMTQGEFRCIADSQSSRAVLEPEPRKSCWSLRTCPALQRPMPVSLRAWLEAYHWHQTACKDLSRVCQGPPYKALSDQGSYWQAAAMPLSRASLIAFVMWSPLVTKQAL